MHDRLGGTRETGGRAGTWIVTPPGWTGNVPEGMEQVASPTPQLFLLGRLAVEGEGDATAIAALYAHHVLHGTATFETVPPDATEIASRMGKVAAAGWPWLVARDTAGTVLGYAYCTQFRERAAYRFASENSVYIRDDARGRGIGTALMLSLIHI